MMDDLRIMYAMSKTAIEDHIRQAFRKGVLEIMRVRNVDTIKAFAAAIGSKTATVYSWLEVPGIPSTSSLVRIAITYNTTVDWLLGLDKETRKRLKE